MENNQTENQEVKKQVKGFFNKNKALVIILVVLFFLGTYLVGAYNSLVVLNENVENKWAQVDNQYQRRYDLIPTLVESVKGAMSQEREVFGELARARASYAGARTISEKEAAGQQMGSALSRLLVIMENYPQLRSVETVKDLMTQLEGTENRLTVARKDFNDEVKNYNLVVKKFPKNILASMFGYGPKDYYQKEEGAEKRPEFNLREL